MQLFLLSAALLVVLGVGVGDAAAAEKNPQVSEEALDNALNDKRYLLRQLKCTLGEAPCDSIGRRLKSLAPLVLRGSCPQCTQMEMRQIQRVLAHVQKNYPKEWGKILQRYASG